VSDNRGDVVDEVLLSLNGGLQWVCITLIAKEQFIDGGDIKLVQAQQQQQF
jgi:hypothetical protein